MRPARAGDEQHCREGGCVDERRPEVGLDEDEHDRHGGETERRKRRPNLAESAPVLREETRQREDEQELPELRGLEAEEAKVDPAPRPACERSGEEDEEHQARRPDVDRPVVAAVEVGIDKRRPREPDRADGGEDALAHDEQAAVARHVVLRDAGDRPEPVDDERADCSEQHEVEPADEGRRLGELGTATADAGAAGACVVDRHQWPISLSSPGRETQPACRRTPRRP